MADDLRDQIARLFHDSVCGCDNWDEHEGMAVQGEELTRADFEQAADKVAPLLAAKDREIERLNYEVMAHQVGDGYQKGWEHGSSVAVRYRDERDKARAEVDKLRAELAEALEVAERVARDSGKRYSLDEAMTLIKDRYGDAIEALGDDEVTDA